MYGGPYSERQGSNLSPLKPSESKTTKAKSEMGQNNPTQPRHLSFWRVCGIQLQCDYKANKMIKHLNIL